MGLVSGLVTYLVLGTFNMNLLGDFGEVVIALGVSLVFMVAGSLFFYVKPDPHMVEVFFPERTPSTTAAVYEFDADSASSRESSSRGMGSRGSGSRRSGMRESDMHGAGATSTSGTNANGASHDSGASMRKSKKVK